MSNQPSENQAPCIRRAAGARESSHFLRPNELAARRQPDSQHGLCLPCNRSWYASYPSSSIQTTKLCISTYPIKATLMATAVQRDQFFYIGRQIVSRINSSDSAVRELNILLSAGTKITDLLPPETLRWRLNEWLQLGAFLMNDRYHPTASTLLSLIHSVTSLLFQI